MASARVLEKLEELRIEIGKAEYFLSVNRAVSADRCLTKIRLRLKELAEELDRPQPLRQSS